MSVTLVALVTAVLGTPGMYRRIQVTCTEELCDPFERPTEPSIQLLAALQFSVDDWAAFMTVVSWGLLLLALGVGLVLVWRRPSMLAVITALQLAGVFVGPFAAAVADHNDIAAGLSTALFVAVQLTLPVLLGMFPDGTWHPRWFRWAWPAIGVPGAALVVADQLGRSGPETTVLAVYDLVSIVLLVGFQIHRFVRVSDWTARQQAKWFVLGFVVLAVNVVVANVLDAAGVAGRWQLGIVLAAYLGFVAVILGLGFALLRYRLYDVSVALRRTVVYAGAVVLLLAAYAGLVALASLSMARSSASIVGAAVVAALALGGGLAVARAGRWFRDRLLGASGRPGGVSVALAHGMSGRQSVNLAETIGLALGLPQVAVLDAGGHALWRYGALGGTPHRESVVDADGNSMGSLLLGTPDGGRLSHRHRRALREVLPFALLVLRAQREAENLRDAQAVATTAREDERRRLRRDLHDGVGPLLAGQLLTLDSMRLATDRDELMVHLEAQARAAIGEVRRISRDLRPAALETGDGLPGALESEARRLRTAGLDVQLRCSLSDVDPPAAVQVAALRIVAEALTNVVRHSGATSASVDVRADGAVMVVTVVDDGHGFQSNADPGVGTTSMRARAEELGGTMEITSGPTGTRVRGRIPM